MNATDQNEFAKNLVQMGIITEDQLAVAEVSLRNRGGNLTDILVNRGFLTKEALAKLIANHEKTEIVSLGAYKVKPNFLRILSLNTIKNHKIVPFKIDETTLTVASEKSLAKNILEELGVESAKNVKFVLSTKDEVTAAIRQIETQIAIEKKNASQSEKTQTDIEPVEVRSEMPGETKKESENEPRVEVIPQEEATTKEEVVMSEPVQENAQKTENNPPKKKIRRSRRSDIEVESKDIIELVNQILSNAVAARASDIHLEPNRKNFLVRIRVDGVLEKLLELPLGVHEKVLSRIKIMAKMDVAENRRPQDGGLVMKIDKKDVDLRVASFPTIHGEACAVRISLRSTLITLEEMGLSKTDQAHFNEVITRPSGIILVTGPTGSGKTTSLYAALNKIDRSTKHVLTVEDPSESEIEGVVQTQINPKAGVTFPVVLRSMLREDPDVIMVGEIRDKETAEISLRAAMTGHLVLSTLHTNSAIGAISRLADLGIENYLISSTLASVMAQRLVRRLCPHCRFEVKVPAEKALELGPTVKDLTAFEAKGCSACNNRGFFGRIGIFELIPIDEEFRVLISNKASEIRLQEKAKSLGYQSMMEDGIEKIKKGLTTIDEVLRACKRF